MAGDIKQKFGSPQTMTVTALQSLADDSYWQSGPITLTALPLDIHIGLALKTNASAGSAQGYARIFLAPLVDGSSVYAADASGSEGSYAPSTPSAQEQIKNAIPLGVVSMKADETTARVYEKLISVLAAWKGAMPQGAVIIIHQKTGQALDSANNAIIVTPVYSQYT